jgi:endogenous inhibitor of DNA gyrase (YacG/DUF329 family)
MTASDNHPAAPRGTPCPICGKPAVAGNRPFCSSRCRDIDLGRWLKGVYRIETDDAEDGSHAPDERD